MRADVYLTEKKIAKSRARAQQMIRRGIVTIGGKAVNKPSAEIEGEPEVILTGEDIPYVGRGGLKLAAAIAHFAVSPAGLRCCDIGASTGGFTDCLLQNGAARVYAVDSGSDQLDETLRKDARVISMERCNARTLTKELLGGAVSFATADVSFTSVIPLLPAISSVLSDDACFLCLVKPQFEVGRAFIGKGGIVKDRNAAVDAFCRVVQAASACGLQLTGAMPSPITGQDGNHEFLAYFRKTQKAVEPTHKLRDTFRTILYEKEG